MIRSFPILICLYLTGCANNVLEYEDSTFSRLDDDRNESLALKNIRRSYPEVKDAHINVHSFKGSVLITGQVNSEENIARISEIVDRMRNVKRVNNELVVAGPTSLISRTNDSYLSTKVRSRLIASSDLQADRIKVVTENGVVYLMGAITRQEADIAVEVTRQVYGIQKIVKVFDYLN